MAGQQNRHRVVMSRIDVEPDCTLTRRDAFVHPGKDFELVRLDPIESAMIAVRNETNDQRKSRIRVLFIDDRIHPRVFYSTYAVREDRRNSISHGFEPGISRENSLLRR